MTHMGSWVKTGSQSLDQTWVFCPFPHHSVLLQCIMQPLSYALFLNSSLPTKCHHAKCPSSVLQNIFQTTPITNKDLHNTVIFFNLCVFLTARRDYLQMLLYLFFPTIFKELALGLLFVLQAGRYTDNSVNVTSKMHSSINCLFQNTVISKTFPSCCSQIMFDHLETWVSNSKSHIHDDTAPPWERYWFPTEAFTLSEAGCSAWKPVGSSGWYPVMFPESRGGSQSYVFQAPECLPLPPEWPLPLPVQAILDCESKTEETPLLSLQQMALKAMGEWPLYTGIQESERRSILPPLWEHHCWFLKPRYRCQTNLNWC